MGNCVKLKWNRKRLGLTQKTFAEKVGVSVQTISRLEQDETAWLTIRPETEDKICSMFDSMTSWQPERADRVIRETNGDMDDTSVEETALSKPIVVCEAVIKESHDGLNEKDEKTLILMEFAYEGLVAAETHEDFVANLNLINRILKKY